MLVTLLPAIALIAVVAGGVATSRAIALLPAHPPTSSSLESL